MIFKSIDPILTDHLPVSSEMTSCQQLNEKLWSQLVLANWNNMHFIYIQKVCHFSLIEGEKSRWKSSYE